MASQCWPKVAGVADLSEAVLGVDGGKPAVDGDARVVGWERGGDAEQGGGTLEGKAYEVGLGPEEAVLVFGVGVRACAGGAR